MLFSLIVNDQKFCFWRSPRQFLLRPSAGSILLNMSVSKTPASSAVAVAAAASVGRAVAMASSFASSIILGNRTSHHCGMGKPVAPLLKIQAPAVQVGSPVDAHPGLSFPGNNQDDES